MVVKLCPRCHQKYTADPFNQEGYHICNSNSDVLDQEDVVVTGSWTDYTGSGAVPKSQVMVAGNDNKLMYTDGFIESKEDQEELTVRGNRKVVTRTRQHYEYIDGKS